MSFRDRAGNEHQGTPTEIVESFRVSHRWASGMTVREFMLVCQQAELALGDRCTLLDAGSDEDMAVSFIRGAVRKGALTG